jgi:hypothetical protein
MRKRLQPAPHPRLAPQHLRIAIALLFLASTITAQRHDAWQMIGPGGGGSMFHPTISPHDPGAALIACDMTGAYITHDVGRSWRMFNLGGTARFFVFDPRRPRTIYAQAEALFRSLDGGDSWSMILPRPDSVSRISMSDDHAGLTLHVKDGPRGAASALAIDPGNSDVLYAAVRNTLWTSADGGATWRESGSLIEGARQIWIGGGVMYVAGAAAVSARHGAEWKTGASPGPLEHLSGGFDAEGRLVVYATSGGRIFVSEDGGAAWRESQLPGIGGVAGEIGASALHPETAYVAFQGLRTPLHSTYGVAKTIDRGLHWELVWQDTRELARNVKDAWLSERFGPGWPGAPIGIGVAPTDANLAITTDMGRVMRTTDGGATWEPLYSKAAPNGWTTSGLDVTTCYGLHFDPFDSRRMFISFTDIGLFVSEDGGASWRSATRQGVPGEWVNTTYWLEFDPVVKGRMWAAVSGVHDLPRPKMWRGRGPESFNGGVVTTEDGGRTWRVAAEGMGETAATHILLDPASKALYVTGFGRGVFRSADGGAHWELRNNGISETQPFAWRLARDSQGTVYVVLARRDDATPGAVYRSTDGAAHWTRLALLSGVTGPNGLAIDPKNPRRLFLAAWGRQTAEGAKDGGVYYSADAGVTWRNVLADDQHIYDVTIDPQDPRVMYAAGFESSAWRSADGGMTWQRLRGFNFKWGHRVIPDERDRARIYITTFGGGVWHGPASGDPASPEDLLDHLLAFRPH